MIWKSNCESLDDINSQLNDTNPRLSRNVKSRINDRLGNSLNSAENVLSFTVGSIYDTVLHS
jgi:hypothetical protein